MTGGPSTRAAPCAVGLDVGTSSLKGLAVGEDGAVLASAEEEYPFATPRPGWSEQDPELWWRAAERVLERLRRAAGEPRGVGLSGQMHGLVALDAADRVLRPAILWNDQRTAAECDEIEARLGDDLVALTGNRAMTGFTAPKLLWMARHEPELHARVAHVMLPKDYVRLRLDGERCTDVTDASGTLWFDVRERAWSARVLDALEVDPAWLPEVRESAAAAGAGDQGAGAVGVGAVRPGVPSVVLGTSGVVLATHEAVVAERGVQASAHAVAGRWFAMGVILSAAGSLRWLRDALRAPYDELLAEAGRWEPGTEGLTFLPYLTGERTPHLDPAARGAFAGLEIRHDRGALVRAVLEGVGYALRDAADLVAVGDARAARVSGGGARSALWLRIVASILGTPLERVAVDEGAAYGAALLGGVAGGMWRDVDEAVAACVAVRETVDPDPVWALTYERERARYLSLYPALSPNSD
jgi:xylulokinase